MGDLDEVSTIISARELTATHQLRLIHHCIDRIPTTLSSAALSTHWRWNWMTLDDRTLFIQHHTQIWNLRITSAVHTYKHDLGLRLTHRQCSPSIYELQCIKTNVWFVREKLRRRLRLTKARTLTADTGSSSLAAPALCVSRRKSHHSASPRTSSCKIQNLLRRESHTRRRKLWQPTIRQRRRSVEAPARLRAGGDGALCAGEASG